MKDVIFNQIKIEDFLPTSIINKSGGDEGLLINLIVTDLFVSNIDYLYKATELVNEVKKLPVESMINDMLVFMRDFETDMVIFYQREIAVKLTDNAVGAMFLKYLQKDYIKSLVEKIQNDTNNKIDDNRYNISLNKNEEAAIKNIVSHDNDGEFVYGQTTIGEKSDCYFSEQDFGFVYVLENKTNGMVKVGKSRSPKTMIQAIQQSIGCKDGRVFVSDRIYGYSTVERDTLGLFAPSRAVGEWFNADYNKIVSTVLREIDSVRQPSFDEIQLSELICKYNSQVNIASIDNSFRKK